ncbi:MAG: calcium/proton exchanger [Candidatus Magnetominusculus sp. LBB02]|nr:calcium/proton exchanger [Candidatus Magnetominusculus sp. LBB02]
MVVDLKKLGKYEIGILDYFLLFIPIAVVLELRHASGTLIFAASAISIIPLAAIMGNATEHLSEKLGSGIGGFLNATFGNAAELIIAIVALKAGFYEVVKASVTGSIIGNILLVLGLSFVAGGTKQKIVHFNATAAGLNSSMLVLCSFSLVVPTLIDTLLGQHTLTKVGVESLNLKLSLAIAIVLFVTYVLSLVFSLKSHKHLYGVDDENAHGNESGHSWSSAKALSVLVAATVGISFMSEFLVKSLESATKSFGMNEVFVGVIVVALVGNAAEHSTAILMALKKKMDVSVSIAIGSSSQVAMFLAPVLIFISYFVGPLPMNLTFTPLETISILFSAFLVNFITSDGQSHWMEGVQLLALYVILGMAYFFIY